MQKVNNNQPNVPKAAQNKTAMLPPPAELNNDMTCNKFSIANLSKWHYVINWNIPHPQILRYESKHLEMQMQYGWWQKK